MKNTAKNISVADYYFELLRNLNTDNKLDLISKLSQSLKKNEKDQSMSLESLYGAYKSEQTADEIIAEIREARTFNRNTESL